MLPLWTVFFCLLGSSLLQAQSPHEGFKGIPWGSSEADVIAKAGGDLISSNGLWVATWNRSNEAAVVGDYVMVPPTKVLVFRTKRGEKNSYFICRDRLCAVVQVPGLDRVFSPDLAIRELENVYGRAGALKIRKDIHLPPEWGKLNGSSETLQVLEWQDENGTVRAALRTWPIDDYREAIRVTYSSKKLLEDNKRIIEEIRRKQEEERRRREEEKKRKEEEARKAAEEAARAKAAAAAAGANP